MSIGSKVPNHSLNYNIENFPSKWSYQPDYKYLYSYSGIASTHTIQENSQSEAKSTLQWDADVELVLISPRQLKISLVNPIINKKIGKFSFSITI